MAAEVATKYKAAALTYIHSKVDDLKENQPGKAYGILKADESTFTAMNSPPQPEPFTRLSESEITKQI